MMEPFQAATIKPTIQEDNAQPSLSAQNPQIRPLQTLGTVQEKYRKGRHWLLHRLWSKPPGRPTSLQLPNPSDKTETAGYMEHPLGVQLPRREKLGVIPH